MDQLAYFNSNIDWNVVEPILLLLVSVIMLALFKKDPLYIQKAMKLGTGIFIVAIILNVIGLITISDNFTVFAFTIIAIALILLFWSDTKI